jgi:hypothetical protein
MIRVVVRVLTDITLLVIGMAIGHYLARILP